MERVLRTAVNMALTCLGGGPDGSGEHGRHSTRIDKIRLKFSDKFLK
jgi:hypothetical protein